MKRDMLDKQEPWKRVNWKVALVSGVVLGAGFGTVSVAQADLQAVRTPSAIERLAENVDRARSEVPAALPTHSAAASVASVTSVASPASVASVTSVASPASVASVTSVASPASVASVTSVASVNSIDS